MRVDCGNAAVPDRRSVRKIDRSVLFAVKAAHVSVIPTIPIPAPETPTHSIRNQAVKAGHLISDCRSEQQYLGILSNLNEAKLLPINAVFSRLAEKLAYR